MYYSYILAVLFKKENTFDDYANDYDETVDNASVYTIMAGDKVISIGLTEDGEVEYCNVF